MSVCSSNTFHLYLFSLLYQCGFLRRKKKAEKEEGEVAGVTVTEEGAASQKETAPTGTRDESTTL